MTYSEATDYLFASAPLFQNLGPGAYKDGLETTLALDGHFNHPHRSYTTIHVAGTNGKGSVSHSLAAILQSMGLRVGLYTSPHLVDFRERIRVNGEKISTERVVRFVEQERAFFEPLHPSFFELATALAFKYFEEEHVDIAVIEVGLGGRLDCTNIIRPALSVITNISLDHTQFLGHTVELIAAEKAGIIKPATPCVIGEAAPSLRKVFMTRAQELQAPLYFAEDTASPADCGSTFYFAEDTASPADCGFELRGSYQRPNLRTILCAVSHLPFKVPAEALRNGLANVCRLTGLMGRWQQTEDNPRVICDTGHNIGAWQWLAPALAPIDDLHIILGMCADKDVTSVLSLMPRHATYYFTQASVTRAMDSTQLATQAAAFGLNGHSYPNVAAALQAARQNATAASTIFIGGSTFVVADYMSL